MADLIAYIDDSKLDGQIMGNILKQLGYPFLYIQDPIQALIRLLEHKPDLIFFRFAHAHCQWIRTL